LVGCGPGKSFPSSHATNNFALATILTYYFRKYRYWFYSIAALVAFSRVYVGVHYPIDISAGAILGTSVGLLFTLIATKIDKKWNLKPESK
jgi:undecaprenyl-diphosphatase